MIIVLIVGTIVISNIDTSKDNNVDTTDDLYSIYSADTTDILSVKAESENGTITVNPYSSSPVRQVLVHELTHHWRTAAAITHCRRWRCICSRRNGGVSANVLRDNITRMYAEQGVTLDTQAANRELTAAFCEKRLFQDDASIQRHGTDRCIAFQRIRQWIADTVISPARNKGAAAAPGTAETL